jgi:hypothetical protein
MTKLATLFSSFVVALACAATYAAKIAAGDLSANS